jgi:hypothetical protein
MFLISTSTSLKGLLQISSCGRLALKPFFVFIHQPKKDTAGKVHSQTKKKSTSYKLYGKWF